MPKVKLIAAIDDNYGIAKDGKLPWKIPADLEYFRDKIQDGPVIMGWGTFASNSFKPFGNGKNIVITLKQTEAFPGVWVAHDIKRLFDNLDEDVWVIGGGEIFRQVLSYATELYLTRVKGNYKADVFFPKFEDGFHRVSYTPSEAENGFSFSFEVWEKNS